MGSWFTAREGTEFRLDKVIAVVVNEQELGKRQCFAVLEGGQISVDLTYPEALRLKFKLHAQDDLKGGIQNATASPFN